MDTTADRIAIQDVMLRYAAGIDDRDKALYRTCFADDVLVVGFTPEPLTGADAWVDTAWEKLAAFAATQHMLGPVLAEVNGDSATCRTDLQALHYMKDKPGTTLTLWGTYKGELKRTPDGWKLTRHELVSRGRRLQSD